MIKNFLILSLSFIFSTHLYASKNVHWNLAISVPTTFAPLSSPSYKIAKMVKEMSNSRFTITVQGKEKHSSTQSILNLVQENTFEIGHAFSSNTQNIDINTIWFTSTPFGFTSNEQYSWFYYGNGEKYMSKVYEKYGVLSFPGGSLGSQMFGWSNKKITRLSDFDALKINNTGILSEILSLHNIQVKNIPLSQNAKALKKKELDFINGITPIIDTKMGFQKVAKYYYTSWERPSSHMQFIVNKEAFSKLSKTYKSILITAMKTAATELFMENFYTSAIALEKIKSDFPNVQILSLPTSILKELENSKNKVFEQYSKENTLFNEIYQDQKTFKKFIRPSTLLGEYSYIKSVNTLK